MKENFQDDNNSISSISSDNNSILDKEKDSINKSLQTNVSPQENSNINNFELGNNTFTQLPNIMKPKNFTKKNKMSSVSSSCSLNGDKYSLNSMEEEKRNFIVNDFIPINTTIWNKTIDFFVNW
jgi:hypothetical protein